MKYKDLNIQTQREFPNNARSAGFGWLVRAGYITRAGEILPLGNCVPAQIPAQLPVLANSREVFFPLEGGAMEVLRCPQCGLLDLKELAVSSKKTFSHEAPKAMEKVSTPDCPTIEALAQFLNLPKEQTAKALMFTRLRDSRFIFVVLRGDMTLSMAKLQKAVGEVRLAMPEEIARAGAAAGYASPVGLKDAFIAADDLIPSSPNLAAGANEHGYHLLNTNYGRDYAADLVTDLTMADAGDLCPQCGGTREARKVIPLKTDETLRRENLLLALAETFHDEKGLTLPKSAAPFDVYLMHVPSKQMDTLSAANQIYQNLQAQGVRVLFDDREERAGVKFNDADLIGCPLRITVGERALKENKVEIKPRTGESQLASLPLDGWTMPPGEF